MRASAASSTSGRLWVAPALAIAIVVAVVVAGVGVPGSWWPETDHSPALVTTDDVNLRSGPGTGFDIVTVISAGTEVAVRGEEHGFVAVIASGWDGWISRDYLAESAGVASAPRVPMVAAAEHSEVANTDDVESATSPVLAHEVQVEVAPQPGEHWIEVNRTTRTVTLHNGEIVVAQFDALIGKDLSPDGYYSTAVGTYRVWVKEKALTETPFAEGVYLTDFVGFDPDRHNGFHSPTRDAQGNVVITGGTQTLGCVRLGEADAVFLYAFADIGMRVEVHD